MKSCPYCEAQVKKKGRVITEHGAPRTMPTIYMCGTVTSPNWSPPVRGAECRREKKG